MTDEKKYDEETQKFYDENKDMIEKILAQEKASSDDSEKAYLEEVLRRAAFERRMRMEYEAEKARRDAFDNAERAYDDFRYGRSRTEEAFDESRDHFRDHSRKESDYFFNLLMEEADRFRENSRRSREYARSRFDEDLALMRESRERARTVFNESFDEYFGPFSDAQFQKHLFGAGLEFWMALNAFIRSAPLPDSVKNAFNEADENRNAEYCRKNQSCRAKGEEQKKESEDTSSRKIKITPLKKEDN